MSGLADGVTKVGSLTFTTKTKGLSERNFQKCFLEIGLVMEPPLLDWSLFLFISGSGNHQSIDFLRKQGQASQSPKGARRASAVLVIVGRHLELEDSRTLRTRLGHEPSSGTLFVPPLL